MSFGEEAAEITRAMGWAPGPLSIKKLNFLRQLASNRGIREATGMRLAIPPPLGL